MPDTLPAASIDIPPADDAALPLTDDPATVSSLAENPNEVHAPSTTDQHLNISNPSDYESDYSDGDSLPEVSQILSQCASRASFQVDPSPSRDSDPLECLSQDEEYVGSKKTPSVSTPMAKEEVIDEPLPIPSPPRSQMQTRKSARKSNQAPPPSSSSSSTAKVSAPTGSASSTQTSTPKSKGSKSTGESPKKGVSTRKRKLAAADEVFPQISASQPLPTQ